MEHFDVVVIGAGLAGLDYTKSLSQQGFKVLLVDRKPTLNQVHTTGIFVRKTLQSFDLPTSCLGPAVRHVNLYSPKRKVLALESNKDEFRVGKMAKLYESYLQDCQQQASVRLATSYLSSQAHAKGSLVSLSSGKDTYQVSCHLLVGADGTLSNVARDLGLDRNKEWIVGAEDVFENVALSGPPRFDCFLDPQLAPGYLAWVVNDGEEIHVGVGGYLSRFNPLDALEKFKASLDLDLSQAEHTERRGGRIPVGGVLNQLANERGLLIGDASGAVSPLTAGGLDPCLRLSRIAATLSQHYLETARADGLQTYSGKLFRSRFISRLWMRRLLAGISSPLALEAACAALRLPGMNLLAWKVFFGRGSFPDVDTDLLLNPSLT